GAGASRYSLWFEPSIGIAAGSSTQNETQSQCQSSADSGPQDRVRRSANVRVGQPNGESICIFFETHDIDGISDTHANNCADQGGYKQFCIIHLNKTPATNV